MVCFITPLIFALVIVIRVAYCTNSRSLPVYNESDISGNFSNNDGIQLMFSSLNFTEDGFITEWSAVVTGNTSIDGLIEFQIFEPDTEDSDTYHLVYHNGYQGNANGSVIKSPVSFLSPFIPIRPGYTVGVYLPRAPRVADELSLLYTTNTGDDDIYYWENINNRTCTYRMCSGRIIKGIELHIGWNFQVSPVEAIQSLLDSLKQGAESYCYNLPLLCIINAPPTGSLILPSSSSSIATSLTVSTPVTSSVVTVTILRVETVVSSCNPSTITYSTVQPACHSNTAAVVEQCSIGLGVAIIPTAVLFILVLVLGVALIVLVLCWIVRERKLVSTETSRLHRHDVNEIPPLKEPLYMTPHNSPPQVINQSMLSESVITGDEMDFTNTETNLNPAYGTASVIQHTYIEGKRIANK